MRGIEGISWTALFTAATSGGVATKLADYLVDWIKTHRKEKKSAKAIVDAHLDPLLKAADEISGKTISLAKRDFLPLSAKNASDLDFNADLVGLAYLYGKFWSRIEILEKESLGTSISADVRGKKLSKFIACLGSPDVRLLNRTHQKAIGEITTELLPNGGLRTIGLVEFEKKIAKGAEQVWFDPLLQLLKDTPAKATRQRLLVYGVVLHALVDTLDPDHDTTHERPSYPNKLSQESKRRIKHLVFRQYLDGTGAVNLYDSDK
jgi:hypothetical protein